MLHAKIPYNHWYDDLNDWFRRPSICVKPSEENPWASWKVAETIGNFTVKKYQNLV